VSFCIALLSAVGYFAALGASSFKPRRPVAD